MKKKQITQSMQRLASYYNFVGKKKDSGIKNITSFDLVERFNIPSRQTVQKDLMQYLDSPGVRKYGYNTTYLHNELAKFLGLNDRPANYYVLGPIYPFLLPTDEIQNRNFRFMGQAEELNEEVIHEKQISILVLTREVSDQEWHIIEKNVNAVINFGKTQINSEQIYIYNLDILQLLINAQLNIQKDIKKEYM